MTTTVRNRILLGFAVFLLIAVPFLFWARAFTSSVVKYVVGSGLGQGWALAVLATAAAAAVLLIKYYNKPSSGSRDVPAGQNGNEAKYGFGLATVSVALLSGIVFYAVTNAYETKRNIFTTSYETSNGEFADYDQRPPLAQAANLLNKNSGDCVGDMRFVNYVVGAKTARWTGLVDGNGMSRKAACVVAWDGTGSSRSNFEVCKFEQPLRAIQGSFANNLNRAVQRQVPRGTWFDESDSYGDCQDGKAVLYLPLLTNSGFVHTYDMPGGLVVATSTQDVRYYPTVKAGQFPGSVYPLSLIAKQEDANKAHGGFWDHKAGRGGYEMAGTMSGATDALDPNLGNQGQFVLRNGASKRGEYVTPLTPIGSGGEIIAGATVETDHVTRGKLNTVKLIRFAQTRPANATTAQGVRSAFANVLPWANANLQIMEIVPGSNGTWNGTIGRQLELLYRFTADVDGATTITNAVTGAVIARASADGQPIKADGTVIGSDGVQGVDPNSAPTGRPGLPGNAKTAELSTAELIRLRGQILAELDKRVAAAEAQPVR